MSKSNKQTLANCIELRGLISMFAVDAKTESDYMALAGTLLASVIKMYQKSKMNLEEIDQVLKNAVDTYKLALKDKEKKN
jgi:hypothetical protein